MAALATSSVMPPAVGCMITPPKACTPRWPSSWFANAAKPEVFWKLHMMPMPRIPAAAAWRTASKTLTER
jgi:hypothetical protein